MFRLTAPREGEIAEFLAAAGASSLSYADIGMASRSAAPGGYRLDTAEVLLGTGNTAFSRAVTALQNWKMFDLGWIKATPSAISIAPEVDVAVAVHHLGFWSLNGCRVVYMAPPSDGTIERYGFAYGTLSDHAEAGEELFEVSHDRDTGNVVYRIRAVSRARAPLARLGYAYTRFLQAKFRSESCRRMQQGEKRG